MMELELFFSKSMRGEENIQGHSLSPLNFPQTPVKKWKAVQKPAESPYFSPSKKTKKAQKSERPRQNSIHEASPDKPVFAPSSNIFCKTEESPLGDPVSVLLERLYELKPLLVQEKVADDPWKVLIAVTLLNKTTGKLAIPVFWTIMEKWPSPLHLSQAHFDELAAMINHLGTQRVRAKRLINMSKRYLQDPPSIYDQRASRASSSPRKSRFFASRTPIYPSTPISHLPGAGTYALDSYRIFCTAYGNPTSEEWKSVMPTDKELIRYLKWKWAFVENIEWTPTKGAVRQVTPKYLTTLIADLENTAL